MTTRLAELTLLHSLVAELSTRIGETPRAVATRPGQPWVGLTTHHAVYVAYDNASRQRVETETDRLQWAAGSGLPVPEVIDHGSGWLVTARVVNHEPLPGGVYATAVIGAAQAVSAVATPPPSVFNPPHHAGHWWTAGVRLARILRSPIHWREFSELRSAAAALAHDRLAHGDFNPRNLLFDRRQGTVTLVDWEFLTYQPAGYDLCMIWPRLASRADRDAVLEAALASTDEVESLGLLHRWLAVRYLADLATKTAWGRCDRSRLAEAVTRVEEARLNATLWCG